jgi:uncharacterized protein (TIGR01777 family)
MNIVIAGGTGFIGEPLVKALTARGDVVTVLSHSGRGMKWHPPGQGEWSAAVAAADAVINLAGENIGAGRWTAARKKRIVDSRLSATTALVEAMRSRPEHRRVFISASAVGFYGDRGNQTLDEFADGGSGFLPDLTARWEAAAREAEAISRLVIFRFGVVLGRGGGAVAKMLLPFRMGIGGRIGSGKQWMSWIAREDVIRIIEWALDRPSVSGVYNATSPEPVTNRDFTRALGRTLHRPTVFPVPAFVLRLLFGQMGVETVLEGQRVVPVRAAAEGFTFAYPSVEQALRHSVA